MELVASNALGIEAASFASGASKDIAESPTAEPERPKKELRNLGRDVSYDTKNKQYVVDASLFLSPSLKKL